MSGNLIRGIFFRVGSLNYINGSLKSSVNVGRHSSSFVSHYLCVSFRDKQKAYFDFQIFCGFPGFFLLDLFSDVENVTYCFLRVTNCLFVVLKSSRIMSNFDANTSTTSFVCQSIRCKNYFVLSSNLLIILYLDVCRN